MPQSTDFESATLFAQQNLRAQRTELRNAIANHTSETNKTRIKKLIYEWENICAIVLEHQLLTNK